MTENLGVLYDRSSDFQQAQFDVAVRLIKEYTQTRDVKTLLDIGCGSGSRTYQCLDIFPNLNDVMAVEPDHDMLSVAVEKYANPMIDYHNASAENMNEIAHKSAPYDAVLSNWVLHWVEDKTKLMNNVNSLTQKDSLFVLSSCENLPLILQDVDAFVRENLDIDKMGENPFHYLRLREWKALLEENGWKIIKSKTYKSPHFAKSIRGYIEHWFSASTAKFMYGHAQEDLSEDKISELCEMLLDKYRDPTFKEGLLFYEDVLFIIAEKL